MEYFRSKEMVRAIILAAGRGSRMKEATEFKPKCLIELNGKPLLQYQIDALLQAGVEEIGIVSGYKREELMPFIKHFNLREFYNEAFLDSNMVYSLMCARDWLYQEEFVISYSDIFYQPQGIIDLCRSDHDISLLYDIHWKKLWQKRFKDPLSDAETFKLNQEQMLLEIGKRTQSFEDIQGQFMGLIKCNKKGFENLCEILENRDFRHLDSTGLLNLYITLGYSVHCVPYDDIWGECDNQDDVKLYEQIYFNNIETI